jgi:hypothetical protein
MKLDLSRFEAEALADLVETYNRLAGRDDVDQRWKAWSREVAEAMRIELAERMIALAEEGDYFALHWFGRLEPPKRPITEGWPDSE